MTDVLTVNGISATRINAIEITRTNAGVFLDCEGDKHWFPLSVVEIETKEETVLIQDWKYKEIFE